MRHRKKRVLLNRFTSWRKSTIIALARNLLIHQRIITTKAKAKAAAPLVEKLISLTKNDSVYHRRRAYQILGDRTLVNGLFEKIAPLFKNRSSGFTRILTYRNRRGDSAQLVIFELTEKIEKRKKTKKEAREIKEPPHPKEELHEGKPPIVKKPTKKFLGGLRGIFKKERDAL
ncbi:MAG: 50S ribosomal protein L17 [Candidatus Omnitrophica bacterium]|nr:50S ribosomal protein L17 [Candidatus Omnitrophota bacterium]